MRRIALAFVCLSTLALSACASGQAIEPAAPTPPAPAGPPRVTNGLPIYMAQRSRLESIAFRLRRAAAPLCEKTGAVKPETGVVVWTLSDFPNAEDKAMLVQRFNLTDAVTVAMVVADTPGAKAQIARGEIVDSVNSEDVGGGRGAADRFVSLVNANAKKGPVQIALHDANGTQRTAAIAPESVCAYPALLIRANEINAAADGRLIGVTTGMLDYARSDDELAAVVGHELAHNVLKHIEAAQNDSKANQGLIDRLLGAVPGLDSLAATPARAQASAFSKDREREADVTGLYFMARAGFDIDAVTEFWRRIEASDLSRGRLASTHPLAPERLALIEKTIAEIKDRQAKGLPLDPPRVR